MSVHELSRTGPAERGASDERAPQVVECPTMLVTRLGCASLDHTARRTHRLTADPARVVFLHPGDAYRVHYPSAGTFRATVVAFADGSVPMGMHGGVVPATAPLQLRFHSYRRSLLDAALTPAMRADTVANLVAAEVRSLAECATNDASPAAPYGRATQREMADRACALLARDPGAPHRLPDLGRALGVSPFHLARVFRAAIGVSIHQYLLRLRLGIALEHLAAGERNLSTLAVSLGFATHSHFSAAFRHAFGCSPRAVRALLCGGTRS